ncbi:MAG: replication initiation protein [Bacteroidales bacterium]|jgi:hypothetical protein|nr:replication initiation protein [Bacteroidales bacterium]
MSRNKHITNIDIDSTFLIQSNKITVANWQGWSVVQRRCYYLILGIILDFFVEKKTADIDNYVVNEKNVRIIFEKNKILTVRENITDAYKALFSLREKTFKIKKENSKGWIVCGFLNWAEYSGENNIEVEVSFKILPYVLQLAQDYTIYQLRTALLLTSLYSQRFYEMCCRYRVDGFFSFEIIYLREIMNISEDVYSNFADFKKRVIESAAKELQDLYDNNNSDLYFTWDIDRASKIGKKITKINFYVHSEAEADVITKLFTEHDYRWHIEVKLLTYFKINSKVLNSFYGWIIHNYNAPAMRRLFEKIIKIERRYQNRKEIIKVLRVMLRQDFGIF